MVSEAHKRATQKFETNNYDKILLRIRKDSSQNRQKIQEAADKTQKSLNAFILEAIAEKIARIEADPEGQEAEK